VAAYGLSCGRAAETDQADIVYTTLPVFASIVDGIVGDAYEVRSLLTSGQSPHTFEPRPSDIRSLSHARLLVYGASNLDEWVGRLPAVPTVSLMSLLPDSLYLPRGAVDPNPHFWLDPLAVAAVTPALAEALCRYDRSRCAVFRANADSSSQGLRTLVQRLSVQLAGSKGNGFVVSHSFLDYYSRRFGLETVNIVEGSGSLEPSAHDLSVLIASIRSGGFAAVITERSEPSPAARTVAAESGLELITVDPLGGGAQPISYEGLLSTLTARLKRGNE